MKKILIIEDDQRHLQNAKQVTCQFPQFEFIFASTLREALNSNSLLNSDWIREFDAIITDLHFPLDAGNEPQQIGITIAMMGRFLGKPVAIVSDIDRHGQSIRWMRELWGSFNAHWNFGPESSLSWLIPETILEQKVEFLPEKYKMFRDIYTPKEDGLKPYLKVIEDLITYWDK